MPRQMIGLDIGQTAVRGAQLRITRGGITVTRYHEVSLPHGVVSQGDVLDAPTLVAALQQLYDEGDFTTRQARLSIGNRHVYVREHSVKRVPLTMLKSSLRYQIDDVLPLDPDKAVLDYFPASLSVTGGQPTFTGLLVAAETEPLEALAQAIHKAKLRLTGVDLSAFALLRALDPTRPTAGADGQGSGNALDRVLTDLIIDFGAGTTQIVAVHGIRPLAVRMLPSGGDDITEVLQSVDDAAFGEAEAAKASTGYLGGLAQTPAEQAIAAGVDRLVSAISDTITFFHNTTPALEHIDRVIITGGGSRMPGLQQHLVDLLGLPVYLGQPLQGLRFASAEAESYAYDHLSTCAVALGTMEN